MAAPADKRARGLIATSGSWCRFWLEWRWRAYPESAFFSMPRAGRVE